METATKRETIVLNLDVKKVLPDVLWVLKARSTDKNRQVLHYMNVDSVGICCTDGKRLHLFKNNELIPTLQLGLYDVIISKNTIICTPVEGSFPDYQSIMPKYDSAPLRISLNGVLSIESSLAIVRIYEKFKTAVNYEYIRDLESGLWDVNTGTDAKSSIEFKQGESRYALMMPLSMK